MAIRKKKGLYFEAVNSGEKVAKRALVEPATFSLMWASAVFQPLQRRPGMLHSLSAFPELVEKLPSPDAVRERLSAALRDVQLLRQLLRLAEHAAKGTSNSRKGATPAR
jgi:hypothetical protein